MKELCLFVPPQPKHIFRAALEAAMTVAIKLTKSQIGVTQMECWHIDWQ